MFHIEDFVKLKPALAHVSPREEVFSHAFPTPTVIWTHSHFAWNPNWKEYIQVDLPTLDSLTFNPRIHWTGLVLLGPEWWP